MAIYFFLSAIETALIGFYLFSVGSEQGNQLLFSLSLSRLVMIAFIVLIAILFLILSIVSLRAYKRQKGFLNTLLVDKKKLLVIFSFCVLTTLATLFALTRQPGFWGDHKLVIENLQPVFVWVLVLSVQTAFFVFLWFCVYFVNNKELVSVEKTKQELLPIFILFFLALIAKWFIVSASSYGPTGTGDEMTYYDMADSMHRGFFSIAQTYHYPPLYPLVFMPALVFGQYTFTLIKLINAILSTSIIFPTYLISRSFLDGKKYLLPVLLVCVLPYHLVFPQRIVSENLYFPIFLWSVLLVLKKPAHKTTALIWDILTGIALGLLYLTRYISLAIIPMFLIAWWIKPFGKNDHLFKPTGKKIIRFALIAAIATLVFSPWIIGAMREDLPVKLALGFVITSRTTPEQLTLSNFLLWFYLYSSYLIIIAAPVLPLLLKSITRIDLKRWREEYGRLIVELMLVSAGFLAAATRHSWRAYYNRYMPENIMGRYILYLSVPFLILALITLVNSKTAKQDGMRKRDALLLIASLLLVLLAYHTIITGKVIPIGVELLRPQGSVDGYYLKELGNLFFILLFVLYILYYVHLNGFNKRKTLAIIMIAQIAFYTLGWPSYYHTLKAAQTYPYLSSKIADLARQTIPEEELLKGISLYIPSSLKGKVNAELYNGLRVHGIDNTNIEESCEKNIVKMPTTYGFIIDEIDNENVADDSVVQSYQVNFYDRKFSIRPIMK